MYVYVCVCVCVCEGELSVGYALCTCICACWCSCVPACPFSPQVDELTRDMDELLLKVEKINRCQNTILASTVSHGTFWEKDPQLQLLILNFVSLEGVRGLARYVKVTEPICTVGSHCFMNGISNFW